MAGSEWVDIARGMKKTEKKASFRTRLKYSSRYYYGVVEGQVIKVKRRLRGYSYFLDILDSDNVDTSLLRTAIREEAGGARIG